MSSPRTYDLSAAPQGHTYTVTVKPEETRRDAWVRVIKDLLLFLSALVFLGVLT